MLPSSRWCSTILVSLVARTPHSALPFLFTCPSLTQCTDCRALLLPLCLYIVVLVYNPVIVPKFLVYFLGLGFAKPTCRKCLFTPSFDTGVVICCSRVHLATGLHRRTQYGHHRRHITTVAKTTKPRAVDNYVLRLSYETGKHSFTAVLVHFPYFIPPKWGKTVAALTCCGGTKCCFFVASHP